MKYNTGLVVGKFCPLHKGHQLVIETALEQCEKVVIISYTSRNLGFDVITRYGWLAELYGDQVAEMIFPHESAVPDDDAPDVEHRAFCAHLCNTFDIKPSAVFTSESYGDGFAEYLSEHLVLDAPVVHLCVDFDRLRVPISVTALRND